MDALRGMLAVMSAFMQTAAASARQPGAVLGLDAVMNFKVSGGLVPLRTIEICSRLFRHGLPGSSAERRGELQTTAFEKSRTERSQHLCGAKPR